MFTLSAQRPSAALTSRRHRHRLVAPALRLAQFADEHQRLPMAAEWRRIGCIAPLGCPGRPWRADPRATPQASTP
jgi:hypothetical protein